MGLLLPDALQASDDQPAHDCLRRYCRELPRTPLGVRFTRSRFDAWDSTGARAHAGFLAAALPCVAGGGHGAVPTHWAATSRGTTSCRSARSPCVRRDRLDERQGEGLLVPGWPS